MEKIIIIGAGQHCNVVRYNMVEQCIYEPACIIDSDKSLQGKYIDDIKIEYYQTLNTNLLTDLEKKYKTNKFFLGFGSMKYRKKVFEFFIQNNWEAVNIIHPNAVVSSSAQIGKGVLIEAGCLITPSPIIGNNVVINTGSQVNHDNIVKDHVYIASGVILSGGVHIGENTLIDDGVIVTLGTKVGNNSLIGAGAIVTKPIPDNVVAYGNPCKIIRENKY